MEVRIGGLYGTVEGHGINSDTNIVLQCCAVYGIYNVDYWSELSLVFGWCRRDHLNVRLCHSQLLRKRIQSASSKWLIWLIGLLEVGLPSQWELGGGCTDNLNLMAAIMHVIFTSRSWSCPYSTPGFSVYWMIELNISATFSIKWKIAMLHSS